MKENENAFSMNEQEIMDYYGYNGVLGKFQLRAKILRSWILHSLSYSSPHSNFAIMLQKARGVKIGKNCHFCPYVQIDLIYPQLVTIEDNVTIGANVMIFAHMNPTANIFLKMGDYPRKVESVLIKTGAVLTPGSIIMAGIIVGKNSIVSPGSVVTRNVPDHCVVVGNPARVVKKIS